MAVSVETQIQRLKNRDGLSKEEALKRIESQMSLEEKVQKADIVWTNEGSIEELEARVHQWLLENFRQK